VIGLADEDDRLAIVDPGALGERRDRGLGHLGVVFEVEVLQSFDDREASVEQSAPLAPLGALLHLGLQQRGEVRERGLLLAGGLGRELPEAGADRGQVQLAGVRFHERLQRLGLRRQAHLALSQ
jgi:hypothetical protein